MQRLGFLAVSEKYSKAPQRIWLHASSVGEVQSARALILELRILFPDAAFVLSCMTEQGVRVARKQVDNQIDCIYAPLDIAVIVNRVLTILRPTVYICLETELWPCMILQAARYGTMLFLLNGRMSERSLRRYLLIREFMRDILACFAEIAVIQQEDAARYAALGRDRSGIAVLGNAKYDLTATAAAVATGQQCLALMGLAPGQLVFVCGSTHTGEEEMLLAVFRELKSRPDTRDLVWIVAPRHQERVMDVERLFGERGVAYNLFSDVKVRGRREDVVLVDIMGELAGLYSVATFVFCGGSLVERGGHNVMEAAVWGKPVLYGPSMKDFADAALLLESAGAGFPVREAGEIIEWIQKFVEQPDRYAEISERARETAMAQQGSAGKQAMLVVDALAGRSKKVY